MITWDLLTANSSAPEGSTTWVNINSLTGGEGINGYYPADTLLANVKLDSVNASVKSELFVVDYINDTVKASVTDGFVDAAITDDGYLAGVVSVDAKANLMTNKIKAESITQTVEAEIK